MARQRLIVGTYGEISCKQLPSGSWQARARYCDLDGVVRQYRKSGETKNKAKANLKAFLVEHTGTFADEVKTAPAARPWDTTVHLTVMQGVTPHSFRRTVTTEIDEVYDAEAAKNQLGHTSNTVTERHYINRKLVVPDFRAATARIAPGSEAGEGTGADK